MKRVLQSPTVAPTKGPYVQGLAVRDGTLVVTSGLTGRDPDGAIRGQDIQAQTRQTLRNLEAVLAEAGGSLRDVIKMTVFLTDDANYAGMQAVREELLAGVSFTSSTVICGLHAPGALVEIEVMAMVPDREGM